MLNFLRNIRSPQPLKGAEAINFMPMNEESGTGGMHAGALAPIFQIAEKLRNKMTRPERIIWEQLRLKPGGFKFRRQHPFGKYILDFYCHSVKLSIEIDGQNHDVQRQKDYDKNRTGFLRDMGVREIRFKNEEVIENLDLVMKEIELELRAGSLQGPMLRGLGARKSKICSHAQLP